LRKKEGSLRDTPTTDFAKEEDPLVTSTPKDDKKPFSPDPKHVFAYLALTVLYLFYFNLANTVLAVFNCESEEFTFGGVDYRDKPYMQR
jgi:hypothetical protein